MNTLVYADVTEEQTSSASSIASTMQQMSISFGVAAASLVTAFFIPDRFHSSAAEMIHGIHQAFLVLGGLTILSTIVFRELKSMDGPPPASTRSFSRPGDDGAAYSSATTKRDSLRSNSRSIRRST